MAKTQKPLTFKGLKKIINNFLCDINPKIKTKFKNTIDKTRSGNVPSVLFQKRTSRYNRTLISWKTVFENNFNLRMLQSFTNGIVVEFINDDWFCEDYQDNDIYNYLKTQLGSSETIASIISFRSENGSISSSLPAQCFHRLTSGTTIQYKGNQIVINRDNYRNYIINRTAPGGIGNSNWTGFLYYDISGGTQNSLKSHDAENNVLLFNPACEYASESVSEDIFLTLTYFALHSVSSQALTSTDLQQRHTNLIETISDRLRTTIYNSPDYSGNLLDYCNNHPSMLTTSNCRRLVDPIQLIDINIEDFAIDDKKNVKNLDLTHNEAVQFDKFYWDESKQCVLSPARPTNLFWGFHESNMMQQNYTLEEYIDREISRVERRLGISLRVNKDEQEND